MGTTLSSGLVVADRYRLVRCIGRGGSSMVWVADHVVTGKRVALKVLTKRGDEVAARFLREARITARLAHPNIVDVHDVFQLDEGDELVMVMDLLEGCSLAEHLRGRAGPREGARDRHADREPALSLEETARIVLAVTSALEAAHALGVVHRDLKPENVFLTDDGALRVLDFGVAKWTRPADEPMLTPSLTETGAIVGTPHYMAPEQVFGEPDVDGRADVWALGIIAYECLAGRRPIEGDNFGQVFKAIAVGDVAPLRQRASGVPAVVGALVDRMLSRARDDRPSLAEVRAAFGNEPVATATSPATGTSGTKRGARTRWGAFALLLLAAAAAAGAAQLRRSAAPVVEARVAVASSTTIVSATESAPSATSPPSPVPLPAAGDGADAHRAAFGSAAPAPAAPASPGPSRPRASAAIPPPAPANLPGRVHGAAPY